MANYYYIDIESNNLTANVAAEILTYIGNHHKISDFRYYHSECVNEKVGGKLYMYIRGISDFSNILKKHNIQDDEVIVEDEFERFHRLEEQNESLCSCRTAEELVAYEKEAYEKVWLMRTHPCDIPDIEARRQVAVERILNTYDDIPEEGYDDWSCGFWNGVMATCRWALGDEEKDNLDT